MGTLIILRGVPGSGKTTWARTYCENHRTAKRVNKDDLRAMLNDGAYSLTNEAFVQQAQIAIIEAAARSHCQVVIDDTNINPDHIETFTELAQRIGYGIRIVDMTTPLEECIRRDAERARPVGANRIRDMYQRLQAQRKV